MKTNTIRVLTGLCLLPVSGMAMAHAGSHGEAAGLGGLLHPLTGLDHLAVMLAVGVWAATAMSARRQPWLPATTFLICMAIGMAAGATGLVLPGVEAGIAASLLVMGLLLATFTGLSAPGTVLLLGLFAVFHGNAHGVEIPAFVAPLVQAAGVMAGTALLHLGGMALGHSLRRLRAEWMLRVAGVVTGGTGVWLLAAA